MERRPTWAKNFRRFGFKSLRSHSWAPSWRRNASLATSLLMEPGLSPEAPCPSHLRVDQGVRSLLCATVADQLEVSPDEIQSCARREPTRRQHFTEVREHLGFSMLRSRDLEELEEELALERDRLTRLEAELSEERERLSMVYQDSSAKSKEITNKDQAPLRKQKQLSDAQQKLQAQLERLTAAEEALSEIYASRSWRLTRPLRDAFALFRRKP